MVKSIKCDFKDRILGKDDKPTEHIIGLIIIIIIFSVNKEEFTKFSEQGTSYFSCDWDDSSGIAFSK